MKIVRSIDNFLKRIEESLLISMVILMVVLAFLQVVLRNVFSLGIIWADLFLRHLVLWVGLMGAVLVTRERRHIKIDILTKIIPEKAKPPLNLFTDIVSLFVTILLTKASYTFVMSEKIGGSILFLNVPTWTMELMIPIGFALMAFHFLLGIVETLFGIAKKEGQ
jgi:TRAP-type C4-dicarboxylate transport system permease small subunit